MKTLESFRVIIISPETLIVLTSIFIYNYWPTFFTHIGHQFKTNNEIWKFTPTIPLAISGFSVQYAWKILFPSEKALNSLLISWPGYWKLKLRVILSITLCVVCVFFSILIWIYSNSLPEKVIGTIFITTIMISLTVAFNQILAALKIRELLEIIR